MPIEEKALEPLRQGMINEIRGKFYYNEAAERTREPRGREMFLSLARDEEGHLHILEQQYLSVSRRGEWLGLEAARAGDSPAPRLNLFPESAAKGLLSPSSSDEQALEMALAMEKRGYDLYKGAMDATSDPAEKAMYQFLTQEESRHYALLDQTLNYLKDKGFWYFQDEEKPIFDQ